MTRDELGRVVRDAWIDWAKSQANPKPSWLVPYDQLSEPDKEADRQIGDAVALVVADELCNRLEAMTKEVRQATFDAWRAGGKERTEAKRIARLGA